jgi:hypothetical protein
MQKTSGNMQKALCATVEQKACFPPSWRKGAKKGNCVSLVVSPRVHCEKYTVAAARFAAAPAPRNGGSHRGSVSRCSGGEVSDA